MESGRIFGQLGHILENVTPHKFSPARSGKGAQRTPAKPKHSALERLFAGSTIASFAMASVVFPGAISAEADGTGATDLVITETSYAADANGNCTGSQPLDAEGFMGTAPGLFVCWEIKVVNNGSVDAMGVNVTNSFQNGGGFQGSGPSVLGKAPTLAITDASGADITKLGNDSTQGNWCPSWNNPNQYNPSGNMYNCQIADLPAGATATVTIVGQVNPNAADSKSKCPGNPSTNASGEVVSDWVCGDNSWVINNANVTSQTADSNPTNNIVSGYAVGVGVDADNGGSTTPGSTTPAASGPTTLTITKKAGIMSGGTCTLGQQLDAQGFVWATQGSQVCYIIEIVNSGSSAAQGVNINDSFEGMTDGAPGVNPITSAQLTGDGAESFSSCDGWQGASYPQVYCNGGTIPAGGTVTLTVVGNVRADLSNATVYPKCANNSGPQPATNQAGSTISDWVCGDASWIRNSASFSSNNGGNGTASQAIGSGDVNTVPPQPGQPSVPPTTPTPNPTPTGTPTVIPPYSTPAPAPSDGPSPIPSMTPDPSDPTVTLPTQTPTMPPAVVTPPTQTPDTSNPTVAPPIQTPTMPPAVVTPPTQTPDTSNPTVAPPIQTPTMPPAVVTPPYQTPDPSDPTVVPPVQTPTMPPAVVTPPYQTPDPSDPTVVPPIQTPTMPPAVVTPPYQTPDPSDPTVVPPIQTPTMPPAVVTPPTQTPDTSNPTVTPPTQTPTMPPAVVTPPTQTPDTSNPTVKPSKPAVTPDPSNPSATPTKPPVSPDPSNPIIPQPNPSNPAVKPSVPANPKPHPSSPSVTPTRPANPKPNPSNPAVRPSVPANPRPIGPTPTPVPINPNAAAADVRVVKTGPATAIAGQRISWNVTVTNFGPANAKDVVLFDDVPTAVTLDTTTLPAGCTASGQRITCRVGTLEVNRVPGQAGQSVNYVFSGTVSQSATGSFTNYAQSASSTQDPIPGNNNSTNPNGYVTTTLQSDIDLAIDKTANMGTLPSGIVPVEYKLQVTNAGPSIATNAVVKDVLPAEFGFLNVKVSPASAASCTAPATGQKGGTLICTIAKLAPKTDTVTITVQLDSPDLSISQQAITNQATVTPGNGQNDSHLANNTDEWTLIPVPIVPGRPGTPGTPGIPGNPGTPGNPGGNTPGLPGDDVPGVKLPGDAGDNPGNASPGIDNPAPVPTPTAPWQPGQIYTPDLAINKSGDAEVQAGGNSTYTFTVELLHLPNDLNFLDVVAVQPMITDQLPEGVSLRDGVAKIVTLNSQTGKDFSLTGGNCSASDRGTYPQLENGSVVCHLAQNMHPGDKLTITVPVKFAANLSDGTILINQAMVQNGSKGFVAGVLNQGEEKDPKPANNTSRITQVVRGNVDLAAKLAITNLKTTQATCAADDPTDVKYDGPGSRKLISVDITNNGKSNAIKPTFNIKRTIEAVADLTAAKIDGKPFDLTGYCDALTTSITCNLPNDLGAGKTVHIDYPITTLASAVPNNDYPDTLTVSSDSPDSKSSNNIAYAPISIGDAKSEVCTAKTPVDRVSDVPAALRDQIDWAFKANGNFVYEITVRPPQGGHYADAANTMVEDVMPIGLVPMSALSTQGVCEISNAPYGKTVSESGTAHADAKHPQYTVHCDLGVLNGNNPDGSSPTAIIYIAGKVDSDAVQLYGAGVTAAGWNWASDVPNVATTTFGEARLGNSGMSIDTAFVDLLARPTVAAAELPRHPATGVDKFALLLALGLLTSGGYLIARRRRLDAGA